MTVPFLGRDPLTVCFSSESRKKLRKGIKYLNTKQFNKSNPKALSELTKEAKENLLKLACDPEGLYEFVVLLQSYIIDIDNDRDNDGNTFVHKIMEGGLACLPHLLYLVKTYNANVDLPNNNGLTPSAVAANCGHERLVEVMVCVFGVSVNSPVNKSNWTLLHCAAANNQPDLIRMLLERGGDANLEDITHCLPCFIAQKHGNIECCQILMHHINERNEMLAQQASQGLLLVDFMSTSDMCLITKDGFTLLMKAVLGNKPATVRAIANAPNCPKDFRQMKLPEIEADCVGLSKVPDHVTQTLKTAVAIAAENGYTECLRILLDCGCNPTIEDYSRMLPIHHAVSGGHKDCVKLIVSQRNGLTGLKLATSLAFSIERTDILNILNEAMSRRQKDIVNPKLFEVAATGDEEALYSLLEDGDDVNPINELSEWPLFNAVRFGHTGVVKMLYEVI
jgi:ankyrin repeat protein